MTKASYNRFLFIFSFLIFNLISLSSFAQVAETPDELFAKARKLAFDDKNYSEAINVSKKALIMNPDHADIRIFLGRLYSRANKSDGTRPALPGVNPSTTLDRTVKIYLSFIPGQG